MSLFQNTLSALKPGAHVRLTQADGRTLEGVVVQNDGEDSLSLQITSLAVLRYAQITCIEQSAAPAAAAVPVIQTEAAPAEPTVTDDEDETEPVTEDEDETEPVTEDEDETEPVTEDEDETEPVTEDEDETEPVTEDEDETKSQRGQKQPDPLPPLPPYPHVEVEKLILTQVSLKHAYDQMLPDERRTFQRHFDKCNNALRIHEISRIESVAEEIWIIRNEYGWADNERVNLFRANVEFLGNNFLNAALCFPTVQYDYRSAYRIAYHYGLSTHDAELLLVAGALAAIKLIFDPSNKEEIAEAAEVLLRVTETRNDISGVRYLAEHELSADAEARLQLVMQELGRSKCIRLEHYGSVFAFLSALQHSLPASDDNADCTLESEIARYLPAGFMPIRRKPDITLADLQPGKKYQGEIVQYDADASSGTVRLYGALSLPFSFSDVTAPELLYTLRHTDPAPGFSFPVDFSVTESGKGAAACELSNPTTLIQTGPRYTGWLLQYSPTSGSGTVRATDVNGAKTAETEFSFDYKDVSAKALQRLLDEKADALPIGISFCVQRIGDSYYAFDLKNLDSLSGILPPSAEELVKQERFQEAIPLLKKEFDAYRSDWEQSFKLLIKCYTNLSDAVDSKDAERAKALEAYRTATVSLVKEALARHIADLSSENWQYAFTHCIRCYLKLWYVDGDNGYKEDAAKLIEQYGSRIEDDSDTILALMSYYMKAERYEDCLPILDRRLNMLTSDEFKERLRLLRKKAECYHFLNEYRSAIDMLNEWLRIVNDLNYTDQFANRAADIYPTLAQLYLKEGDLTQAAFYAAQTSDAEKRADIEAQISAQMPPDNPPENPAPLSDQDDEAEPDAEPDAETETDSAESAAPLTKQSPAAAPVPEVDSSEFEFTDADLEAAYAEYLDPVTFDAKFDEQPAQYESFDTDTLNLVTSFRQDQLYCLLTYVKAAEQFAGKSQRFRTEKDGSTVYIGQNMQLLSQTVGFAFHSPLLEMDYVSSTILTVFESAQKLLGKLHAPFFAAAALYSLFHNRRIADYRYQELPAEIAKSAANTQYPSLLPLAEELCDFRSKTGSAMDVFVDYKTVQNKLASVIAEANACRNDELQRQRTHDSLTNYLPMRRLLFLSDESKLKRCLDAVIANDTSQYETVRSTISEQFLRRGHTLESGCIDDVKVRSYINMYWAQANKDSDDLFGARFNNAQHSITRCINCILDWLTVTEHSTAADQRTIDRFEALKPSVLTHLKALTLRCEELLAHEFDWGTEALRLAAAELTAKLNCTFDPRERKYLFIPFLTGKEILLTKEFLPDLHSTFYGWTDLNLLKRIESHALMPHQTLSERLHMILSDDAQQHDFRSALCIQEYAQDMGITSLANDPAFQTLSTHMHIEQGSFEQEYQKYRKDIRFAEENGRISASNGETEMYLSIGLTWFQICRITMDYGFYRRIKKAVRNQIFTLALKKYTQMLEELTVLFGKYDFGSYSFDYVKGLLDKQRFTSAELIMNSICKGDTAALDCSYADEAFQYFDLYQNIDLNRLLQITRVPNLTLEEAVLHNRNYSDLFTAVRDLRTPSDNMDADTTLGCDLIRCWPEASFAGTDRILRLLQLFGFEHITVKPDAQSNEDAYLVRVSPRPGRINYPHPLPAFGSDAVISGFRVVCLYNKLSADNLLSRFSSIDTASLHTIVLLNSSLTLSDRRKLARRLKEAVQFTHVFIVIDRPMLLHFALRFNAGYVENNLKRLMAVTMPYAYYQPYVSSALVSMPPELFTGRERELRSIEDIRGANLVYGGRQLGKTALLKMAQRNIDRNSAGARAVYLEIKDCDCAKAARLISQKLASEDILSGDIDTDDWDKLALALNERLSGDSGISYLLLMLDEADHFIEDSLHSANRPFSAIKNINPDRFKLVLAGLHNLSRYHRQKVDGNSVLAPLVPMIIRPFQRPEAVRLLRYTLAYLGFSLSDEMVLQILAKTHYYPSLIQYYCEMLLKAMQDHYAGGSYYEGDTPPYVVTEEHYKKILDDPSFKFTVNMKLRDTLFVENPSDSDPEHEPRSDYHVLALIISYLLYTKPDQSAYTMDDIRGIASRFELNRVNALTQDHLEALLMEMCDLNVLNREDDGFRFATEGFQDMLGSLKEVNEAMSKYAGEEETA